MMLKCWICPHQKSIRKSNLTPGGKQNYVISCRKEKIAFEATYDEHNIDLPCVEKWEKIFEKENLEELKEQ